MSEQSNPELSNKDLSNQELSYQELLSVMEKCGHFLYHRRGGKRGQRRILKILMLEGEKTQKELQDRLGIQSGSISEIVSKMENSGLVMKKKDTADKRKINLVITEEGIKRSEDMIRRNQAQEKTMFDALSEQEKAQLKEILSKLYKSWEVSYGNSLDQAFFVPAKGEEHA